MPSTTTARRARTSLHMSVELAEWLDEQARRLGYEVKGVTKADVVDAIMAAGRASWPAIEAEIRASRTARSE